MIAPLVVGGCFSEPAGAADDDENAGSTATAPGSTSTGGSESTAAPATSSGTTLVTTTGVGTTSGNETTSSGPLTTTGEPPSAFCDNPEFAACEAFDDPVPLVFENIEANGGGIRTIVDDVVGALSPPRFAEIEISHGGATKGIDSALTRGTVEWFNVSPHVDFRFALRFDENFDASCTGAPIRILEIQHPPNSVVEERDHVVLRLSPTQFSLRQFGADTGGMESLATDVEHTAPPGSWIEVRLRIGGNGNDGFNAQVFVNGELEYATQDGELIWHSWPGNNESVEANVGPWFDTNIMTELDQCRFDLDNLAIAVAPPP